MSVDNDWLRRAMWEEGMVPFPDAESEKRAVEYMAEQMSGDAPRDEFGNLFIVGYNLPTQEELAEAESRRARCQKCKSHHQTWERCSPNQKAEQNMGLSILINDVTDEQIAKIRKIIQTGEATAEVTATAEPVKEKAGKKGKKGKSEEPIETTATESAEVEVYKEKALAKKERAELVSISEAIGIPEAETKGKRVPTLVQLILAKQEALANAGEDGDDDDFKADDDEDGDAWNEDVPPASDEEPKKAKKDKGGKDKKKGKKKK